MPSNSHETMCMGGIGHRLATFCSFVALGLVRNILLLERPSFDHHILCNIAIALTHLPITTDFL